MLMVYYDGEVLTPSIISIDWNATGGLNCGVLSTKRSRRRRKFLRRGHPINENEGTYVFPVMSSSSDHSQLARRPMQNCNQGKVPVATPP